MQWLCSRLGDFSQAQYDAAYADLSKGRKMRIDSYRRQEDKRRSLAGEILAKKLAGQFGIAAPVVENLASGQPILAGTDICISIAHSGDLVVCAADTAPIGIDAELMRPFRAGMLRHVCTAEETAYVLGGASIPAVQITDPSIIERFFTVWTAKEAYFKKAGTGITNLRSVNILPLQKQTFRIAEYIIQII